MARGLKKIILLLAIMITISFFPSKGMAAEWSMEIVDNSSDATSVSSLALDSNNNPYISYIDNVTGFLKLAKKIDNNWDIENVISIGVPEYGDIYSTSLALDLNDNPTIAYTDANHLLHLTEWGGSQWNTKIVDDISKVDLISLVLDAGNNARISFGNRDAGELKYAIETANNFQITTIDYSFNDGSLISSSLALDSNDYPHICYAGFVLDDYGPNDLKYAHWDGHSWDIQLIDTPSYIGGPSIAIDANNTPHTTYSDNVDDILKYAKLEEDDWVIDTVDDSVWGLNSVIQIDSKGDPHICYRSFGLGENLRYAIKTGDEWHIEPVDFGLFDTIPISFVLDSHDNPHISFGDVNFFTWVTTLGYASTESLETSDDFTVISYSILLAVIVILSITFILFKLKPKHPEPPIPPEN